MTRKRKTGFKSNLRSNKTGIGGSRVKFGGGLRSVSIAGMGLKSISKMKGSKGGLRTTSKYGAGQKKSGLKSTSKVNFGVVKSNLKSTSKV